MSNEELKQVAINLEYVYKNIKDISNSASVIETNNSNLAHSEITENIQKQLDDIFCSLDDLEVDILSSVQVLWSNGINGQDEQCQDYMRTRIEELGL